MLKFASTHLKNFYFKHDSNLSFFFFKKKKLCVFARRAGLLAQLLPKQPLHSIRLKVYRSIDDFLLNGGPCSIVVSIPYNVCVNRASPLSLSLSLSPSPCPRSESLVQINNSRTRLEIEEEEEEEKDITAESAATAAAAEP